MTVGVFCLPVLDIEVLYLFPAQNWNTVNAHLCQPLRNCSLKMDVPGAAGEGMEDSALQLHIEKHVSVRG